MTLVLGLPAIFWSIRLSPSQKKKSKAGGKTFELNRLSSLLTLTAVLFFTGVVWTLGRKGRIEFNDGLVLVGLFLFWQCFHVFDVLKSNVRQGKSLSWTLPFDLALLAIGAYGIYVSTDWLVAWISHIHTGVISAKYLGWLSGWLMVLPNAVLAFYYGWRKQPEVVYASQVGDAHVSIPLCIGIYALYHTMDVPSFFHIGMLVLLGATLVHFVFIALFGRLPRFIGGVLVAAYGYFLWKGLLG
jgi:cation:H+ antiporter